MEERIINCPFCEKPIRAFYKPSILREMKKSSWGGSKSSFKRDEERLILPEKCPNCGKSGKEIEKILKEGKQLSHDEIIKRMKEAGLDPSKLK